MARYRVNTRSFFDRLYEAGEQVDFGGVPGSNLEPLDDEARAAKEAADAAKERRPGLRSTDGKRPVEPQPLPPQPQRALAEIQENWRDLPPEQRINLARKLGAPVRGTNTKRADEWIETELARRATV
jgi:hypothetical protein